MKPEEMWSRFCSENGINPATHYEAWQFGGAPDNLAALVMTGQRIWCRIPRQKQSAL